MQHQVRFCQTSDGLRIAYASLGTGPPLLQVLGWLTHLEFGRTGPLRWVYDLARHCQLLYYDGRGVGLSDRAVTSFTLEEKLRDVEAVLAASGLDRVALLGTSEGGATAIAYAVRHPERVRRLVLFEATVHADQTPLSPEALAAMLTLIREGWGQDTPAFRQLFTALFYPDADEAFARWFNQLQQLSATPETAARYLEAATSVDVRPLLHQVTVPTLVIHRRGDLTIPAESGRQLAAAIPGARFVLLEGRNHIPLPDEPEAEQLVQLIADFVAEPPPDGAARLPGAPSVSLSPREHEVLRLLATGQSNQRIAETLFISPNTVVRHVSHLFDKLDASNRTEAAARAQQLGLLA